MNMDKETFVNALMQEHKTNPERIVKFAMLALDELDAYNKGKRDMLDEINKEFEKYRDLIDDINKEFEESKAELMREMKLALLDSSKYSFKE